MQYDACQILEEAFIRLIAEHHRGAAGRRDFVGIHVTDLSRNEREFELQLVFRCGTTYCCMEQGCHLGCWRAEDWSRIRSLLVELGASDLGLLTASVRVIVEQGARFQDPEITGRVETSRARTWLSGPYSEAEALLGNYLSDED